MKIYQYRASNLKSTIIWPPFHSGSHFWHPLKTVVSCDLFIIITIIIFIINFFRRVFSECPDTYTTRYRIQVFSIMHRRGG